MQFIIISFAILMLSSCHKINPDEYCLENYLNRHINQMLQDTFLVNDKVDPDSTIYEFYFNKNSRFIKSNRHSGYHNLFISVKNDRVEKIEFKFINVGSPELSEEDIQEILKLFCIDQPIIRDNDEKVSNINFARNNANIDATYYWEKAIKGVLEIKYELI